MNDRQARERDEAILASLREAASRIDPVPASVREAAVAAFSWRTVDAELARLVYDSVLDERALEGVRGDGGPRLVTFEGSGVTVEVEVAPQGRLRRLVGQLVPPGAATVHVHHASRVSTAEADELGRFAVEEVLAGPVRISCQAQPAGPRIDTEWVTL